MSLASSVASGVSSPPLESKSRPHSRGKDRALAFLRIGKKSPRSPSTNRGDEGESPQQDDGISMPWNFQHNIHVDDGLVGMPPSWSTSLAAHGFSEEEIAMLQHRRAESRSPSSQNLFNLRPDSPKISHPYQTNGPAVANTPLLANPAPRTTSLPRQYSDASLRSGAQPTQQRPPLPFSQSSASMSTSSLHSNKAASISSKSRLVPQRHPNSKANHTPQLSISLSSDSNHSSSGKEDSAPVPYIPPRLAPFPSDVASSRTKTHTINGSTSSSIFSSTTNLNGDHRNESSSSKRFFSSQPDTRHPPSLPTIPQSHSSVFRSRAVTDANPLTSAPALPGPSTATAQTLNQSRRAPGSAPRLSISLHNHNDSSDLSSWAGDFLEGLASGDLEGTFKLPQQPTSPQSAPPSAAFKSLITPPYTGITSCEIGAFASYDALPSTNQSESQPPPRALPRLDNLEYRQEAIASPPWTGDYQSSSPLWSQLEGILGTPMSASDPTAEEEHGPYSAALAENFSPTLPFSPEEERMAAQRRMRTELRAKEAHKEEEDDHRLSVNTMRPNRDSTRSSTSTISAGGGLGAPPTIVRNVFPPSPLDSNYSSDDGYNLTSPPSSANSQSQEMATPISDGDIASPLLYYLHPSPSPSRTSFSPVSPISPPQSKQDQRNSMWDDEEYEDGESGASLTVPPQLTTTAPSPSRPTIVISDVPQSGLPTAMPSGTPLSPFQRYRGWLSEVVAPLEDYIDEIVDPRDHYLDLKEIAEGESGSVYSARLTHKDAGRLRLPPLVKARDAEDIANGREILVAIKSVAIVPSGSPKLTDLRHELSLMRGLSQDNLISLDALYVDLLEDTLWIRMELMERSLADVVALVDGGLILPDRTMARFASDILRGLEYLQEHNMAHRDIRSDNLLVNKQGVLKITDFANAVQVPADYPMREDAAGVLYWQAPEVRNPPYNVLKIDVWSLGATVWEMSETQPPFADTNQFADRWPSVQQPEMHSPAFHDFLRLCSEPAATRPTATELLKSAFIRDACGRPVIVHLLSQCLAIEAAY
ncbi:STE/STE20/PAKA protein kinase [Ephemerocybe angulata]|uniref:STE/STE20/PAKA protein kinase n=1 Tax=Ephemerocybe angulata TaxID=980116 RepID=A0A8H6H6J4_9AGAR|nr:STE/STE20/PAKA protein kinase [Tulosesus angulatus]